MAIFASQAQNFDPEPWLFISDQVFGEFRSATDKGYHAVSGTYYAYSPRPEYDNRVNPVLAAYRHAAGRGPAALDVGRYASGATMAEILHADRVFRKLGAQRKLTSAAK